MQETVLMNMRSNDGRSFQVPWGVARMFVALCPEEFEEDDTDIDCLRIDGDLLERIIQFCQYYQEEPMITIDVKSKEKLEEIVTQTRYLTFIQSFDKDQLFRLIQAANYADIKPLLNLSVLALCVKINNKSEDEIRQFFNYPKP